MSLPLFLIPILAGLVAQALKPICNHDWYTKLETTGRELPRYGGMPSAHTAFVAALATTVGYTDGWTSTTFALASALTILVLDDALRMRMFLGRYGWALRHLIAKLPEAEQTTYPYLEARLGHKAPEVLAGAMIGSIIALLTLRLLSIYP